MPDINIQQAKDVRWRRSTRWQWVFGLLLAGILTWGMLEMVDSARSTAAEEVTPESPVVEQMRRQAEAADAAEPETAPAPPDE